MLRSATLDDLTIHDPLDSTCPYAIDELEGMSELDFRVTSYERAGEDGGFISASFLPMRPVAISGVLRGADAATFMTNRKALENACRLIRNATGRPELKRFEVTTQDGSTYYVEGVVKKLKIGVVHNNYAPFAVQLLCPDPQVFSTTSVTSGAVTRPASVGASFPWMFDPDIEFGATTGGVVVLENTGSADVWPVLTLTGPLTNPTVIHDETGTTMQLNATIGVGSSVVIDMKEHTIVLNASQNYLSTKTADSDWFSLLSGNNTIRFNTGSSSDTGTLEVTFNPGSLGI